MQEVVTPKLEAHYSVLALIGTVAFCGGGGLALWLFAGSMGRPSLLGSVSYAIAAMAFAVALTHSYRLLTAKGRIVVTIDATGFKDIRLTPAAIPWSAIRSVSPYILSKQSTPTGVAVVIDPIFKRKLSMRLGARLFNWSNMNFGSEVYVDTRALDADSGEIARTAQSYVSKQA
jgi:hypothetical protein